MLSVLLGTAFVSRQFWGGGWLAGVLYDHFGTYAPAFAAGVAANAINLAIVGMLVTWWQAADVINPAVHFGISDGGPNAWFGRPDVPQLEKLVINWVRATDDAKREQLADEVQRTALSEVTYVPWGQWSQPTALRKNVRDVLNWSADILEREGGLEFSPSDATQRPRDPDDDEEQDEEEEDEYDEDQPDEPPVVREPSSRIPATETVQRSSCPDRLEVRHTAGIRGIPRARAILAGSAQPAEPAHQSTSRGPIDG
jgi:hypothetical protein